MVRERYRITTSTGEVCEETTREQTHDAFLRDLWGFNQHGDKEDDGTMSTYSTATSAVAMDVSGHGSQRMDERQITRRQLQRTIRYGRKTPARDGRVRHEYGGIVSITDSGSRTCITAMKTQRVGGTQPVEMPAWCHSCSLSGGICCKHCGGTGNLADDGEPFELCVICEGAGGMQCLSCACKPQVYAAALAKEVRSQPCTADRAKELLQRTVERLQSAAERSRVDVVSALRRGAEFGLAPQHRAAACGMLRSLEKFQQLVCERWLETDRARGIETHALHLLTACCNLDLSSGDGERQLCVAMAYCATFARMLGD